MKKITALIIEDIELHRSTLKTHLAWSGYEVDILGEAEYVDEAHQLIKKLKPELIFLDIALKGGTAFDLLKRFVNEDAIDFKIIFTTAHGENENVIRSLEFVGIDEFITKPLDTNELKNAITLAIGDGVLDKVGKEVSRKKIISLFKNMNQPECKKKEIVIQTIQRGLVHLTLGEINYLEANDSIAIIHLVNHKKINSSKGLVFYRKTLVLKEECFFLIRRDFIVNLDNVKAFVYTKRLIEMNNGEKVYASREIARDLRTYMYSIDKYVSLVRGNNFLRDFLDGE